jgi:glycosyltransferase involved in cell wall biosynthesis
MTINIRFVSKIYDNHSLAIVTRKMCLELIKNKDFSISIVPIDKFNPANKINKEELLSLKPHINKELKKCDIEVRHTYPPILMWPSEKNTKVVFIQPWEYNRIPMEWKSLFQDFADLVVTPSTWVANIYAHAGIDPDKIKVVPNGYDPKVFNKNYTESSILDKNRFNVTFVGNAQYRKGADLVLQAWHRSFVRADNAVLLVKDNPQIYGDSNLLENIIQMQYKSDCTKIIYNNDTLSEEEMAAVYKNTSILLHPYRGEGFGMHIQEAMACGAFPLVTGVGASNDFVDEVSGMKLNAKQNVIDANDPRYFIGKPGDSYTGMGSHFWVPEVDLNDLVNKLRGIYYHHERHTILNRVNNAKLFTWEVAANTFAKELVNLASSKKIARYA